MMINKTNDLNSFIMALPKPVRPEYSTTIPSTGKKIKYQAFTVREEKVVGSCC